MKTALPKVCLAVLFSLLMTFLLVSSGSVLAADNDAADFGMRAIRITNPSDPQIPCPVGGNCIVDSQNRWSFDISWFDPVTEKYYLADRSNLGVDIVDTTNDTVSGVIPMNVGTNGVLVTTRPHQVWAGGNNSHVLVFSLDNNGFPTSSTPFADIDTGGLGRADELAYDPDDQLILIANDEDSDLFLSFITVSLIPNRIKLGTQIHLNSASTPQGDATGCGIEQPVYDRGTRMFYVAVPCTSTNTNGEILVIDPRTQSVDNVYALPTSGDSAGCFPHGLALGPRENLLLGCSADKPDVSPSDHQLISIIMNTGGTILETFHDVGGSDEVWYNPGDNNYYLAASNHTATGITGGPGDPVLGVIDAGSFDSGPEGPQWIQNVPTGSGAHSVAAVFASKNRGRALGRHGNINPNNVTRNRIYVPLRISTTENGGIGVIGEIP
jgi:hypothetical protein